MRRREFIAGLGGAGTASAVAWPLAVHAQQPAMHVVGWLEAYTPEVSANYLAAFRKGLSEMGYVEGRNVAIDSRSTMNQNDRVPELVAEFVRRRVAVIVAAAGNPAVEAKAATSTIPIVFATAADPVALGLVPSFNRPGGNVTGFSSLGVELGPKRLGLLHELVPRAARFALLVDPIVPSAKSIIEETQAAAATIGVQIEVFTANTNREIDVAFASLMQKGIEALVVAQAALFDSRRAQLITLAAYHRLPAIYGVREFVPIGGLMSYGTNWVELFRQVGIYTGRILKGEKPADLPVIQPTTFQLVINLQTARTLGIEVPATLLVRADEVIE
jgi:putative tryptophan/tyrosine transport system substrate-binding protein